MARVRFFGVLRLELGVSAVEIDADNISELLKEISRSYEKLEIRKLRGSVIYVNEKSISDLRGYKTKLNKEDEVIFLSPVSGG